jgi:hypothetical protein
LSKPVCYFWIIVVYFRAVSFCLICTSEDAAGTTDGIFAGLELPEKLKAELLTNIKRRLTPQPVKLRSGIYIDALFWY